MGSSLYNRWVLWAVGWLLLFGLRAAALARDPGETKANKPTKAALYDPKADARAQVEAAVARARRDHSRVLVMFGFEGCSWCHWLHALFERDQEIRKVLRDEYVLVLVDIHAPHADELLREVKGVLAPDDQQEAVGFPFLGVLDGNGKVVTAQPTGPLEKGKGHGPALVNKFLDRWVAPPAPTPGRSSKPPWPGPRRTTSGCSSTSGRPGAAGVTAWRTSSPAPTSRPSWAPTSWTRRWTSTGWTTARK
jgi:thioredoxin-related protein